MNKKPDNWFARRAEPILLAALLYILPPLLIWFGLLPFEYRFVVLIVVAGLLAAVSYRRKYALCILGIRNDTLRMSLFWNGILTAVLVIGLVLAYYCDWIRPPTVPAWSLFFGFYLFISTPAQEFIFRGYLFAEMNRSGISSRLMRIVISSVLYSWMHVIYNDVLTLVVTLCMGLVWGFIYDRYPNLMAVSLSHAVLGVISILSGVI